MTARTLRLTFAYDGSDFVGWQAQSKGRTIQQTLEAAWQKVTGESLRITASGRTDSGVHAVGQVASLDTQSPLDTETLRRALDANTTREIAIRSVEHMPDGFHAIRDARGKLYAYHLHVGIPTSPFHQKYAWNLHFPVEVDAMRDAARYLMGRHDFSSFEASGSPRSDSIRTVKVLNIEPVEDGFPDRTFPTVRIDVGADGFLYNMVRNIVGSLVEVGRGKQPPVWIEEVLHARDRRVAAATAPAGVP